jgi:acyl-CoA thioester hydrolase/1,4-dihydroxy-2-naphthoyl-CoA hydrolase
MKKTNSPIPYSKDILIPFHCLDGAGIIFFGHVFTLAHQIFETFVIEGLECPWQNWFQNPDWIVPIKSAEASFQAPIRGGEICKIELHVPEMRNSSFSLAYQLIQKQQLCCTVKTVHVFCDRQTQKKCSIPSQFVPLLTNFRL